MIVLNAPSPSAAVVTERRRVVRYPCSAHVRIGTRSGVTCDMSNLGLVFRTRDGFAADEIVEVCLSFEGTADAPLQVIHPARVVRIDEHGRVSQVALQFLD
jgi:hypothetical protein